MIRSNYAGALSARGPQAFDQGPAALRSPSEQAMQPCMHAAPQMSSAVCKVMAYELIYA